MRKICFYNHYHNGDIFCSKAFVQHIMDVIPTEYFYAHRMNPKILEDMNLTYVPLNLSLPNKEAILYNDEIVYINTWIGAYFDKGLEHTNECTLRFAYSMYRKIYEVVSKLFDVQIDCKSIEEYYPLCNYDRLNLDNVNEWLAKNQEKKILISNGPCHSGQCEYNGDMTDIINGLAASHKNMKFITTHKIMSEYENVIHTSDITRINDFDLNEISYLSTMCSVIIGRNSGPICFCSTKQNLNDKTKTFYTFGTKETDCLTYGLNLDSKHIFEKYDTIQKLENSINSLIDKVE